jgi:PAS domain S-box-containing protein
MSPDPLDSAQTEVEQLRSRVRELEEERRCYANHHHDTQPADASPVYDSMYWDLFCSTRDAIMLLDPSSRTFLSANPSAVRLFGTNDEDDFVSHSPWELSPERQPDGRASAEKAREMIEIAVRVGYNLFEWTHKRPDGTAFPTEVLLTPFVNQGVTLVFATVRDISERKSAEETLVKASLYARSLLEANPDGLVVIGLDGTIIDINDAGVELTGVPRDSLIGSDAFNYVTDAEKARAGFKKSLAKGELKNFPLSIRSVSGRLTNVIFRSSVYNDQDGNPVGIVAVARDITELAHAQEELRKSLDLLRTMERVANIGAWEWNVSNGSMTWSEQAYRMMGRDPEAFPCSIANFLACVHPEDRRRVEASMATTVTEKKAPDLKWRLVQASGRERIIESRAEVTLDGAGKVVLVSGTSLDVTEREASRVALQDTLKSTVAAIANAIEMRDAYTAGHQRQVAELSVAIAREMGLSDFQIEGIYLAASIHDLGKIKIPAEILGKPGRLDEFERHYIQRHPQYGFDIIKGIEFPWPIAQTILQHHERLDGSGYPNKLKNNAILLEARILAVADVVDAMISHRPYRPAVGCKAALEEINGKKGILYDALVVDACTTLFQRSDSGFARVNILRKDVQAD